MICPRCDEQGEIYKVKIKEIDNIIYICDECEACWENKENIKKETFQDLSTYLESKGTSYTDSHFEALDYKL